MSEKEVKPRCPRCGGEISWVESQDKGGRVYYYAVHYMGYSKVGSKIKKKVRRCYLGPELYEYVTKTHTREGLVLKGLADGDRALEYLGVLINYLSSIELDKQLAKELSAKLKQLADRLEKYAEKETEEEAK